MKIKIVGLIFLLIGLITASAFAQEPVVSADSGPVELTESAITNRIQDLSQNTQIVQEDREKATEQYKQALSLLKLAQDWQSKADNFETILKSGPSQISTIRKELSAPIESFKVQITAKTTLGDLEQKLILAETDRAIFENRASELEASLKKRSYRSLDVRKDVRNAKMRLDSVAQEINPLAPSDGTESFFAKSALLNAREMALRNEINSYIQELLSVETRGELLSAQLELAYRKVMEAGQIGDELKNEVRSKRREEAQKAVEKALEFAKEASYAKPLIVKLAKENADITRLRAHDEDPLIKFEKVSTELNSTEQTLEKIQSRVKNLQVKIDAGGLSDSLGLMLRNELENLPDVYRAEAAVRLRQVEIGKIQLRLINLEEQRVDLARVEQLVSSKLTELEADIDPKKQKAIEEVIRDLLNAKRSDLKGLINDYNTYYNKLVELDSTQHEMIETVKEFKSFIDERILWVKSAAPFGFKDIPISISAIKWMLDPGNWMKAVKSFLLNVTHYPVSTTLGWLLFVALLTLRGFFKRKLNTLGDLEEKHLSVSFLPTIYTLLLTIVLSVMWPLFLFLIGWRIAPSTLAPIFTTAVSGGIKAMAVSLLIIEFARRMTSEHGLAHTHFEWSRATCRLLHRRMGLLIFTALPLVFFVAAIEGQGLESRKETLGRMLFIVILVGLSIFMQRILRPKLGVLADIFGSGKKAMSKWVRRLIYITAVFAPLVLAALSVTGYVFTSWKLALSLFASLCLVMGIVVLRGLLLRWLYISNIRLMMEENKAALQEKEEKQGDEMGGTAGKDSGDDTNTPVIIEPVFDLNLFNTQTLKILRIIYLALAVTGLWLIWSNMLPALGIFDQVELWSTTSKVTEKVALANGGEKMVTLDKVLPVSLGDLLLAVLIVIFFFMASRNLPGFLQLTVMKWLNVDRGGQYAISTLFSYIIVIIGVVVGFGAIGIGWNQVQWLAAAVTVGLGFGLQEIFANFVSGIILLTERPIRVGDVVTIAGTEGTVTRIRIRATTVESWDRSELVIPNKEFITGQLINWTLSNELRRLILKVGVAYGSDVTKATKLLYKIGKENKRVLDEQNARVVFTELGDSALLLELRVYVNGRDNYLNAMHELNQAIHDRFRAAGLEIVFPQHDLHIRSISAPIPVRNITD